MSNYPDSGIRNPVLLFESEGNRFCPATGKSQVVGRLSLSIREPVQDHTGSRVGLKILAHDIETSQVRCIEGAVLAAD